MEELELSEEEIEIEVEEEVEIEVEEEEEEPDVIDKNEKEKEKKDSSNKRPERKSIIIKKKVSGDARKDILLRASLSGSINQKYVGKEKSNKNVTEFNVDKNNSKIITENEENNNDDNENLELHIIESNDNKEKEINDNENNNINDRIKTKEEEEYIQKMISILQTNEIENLLESKKWEDKKTGLTKLNEFIEKSSNISENLDTFVIYIKFKLNNFKETNFNIIKEGMRCFCSIFNKINRNNQPNKEYIEVILSGLNEKIGETKLKDVYIELSDSLMKCYSEKIIIDTLLNLLENCKKVNVLKEYAEYIDKIIEDKLFKVDLNVKGIINFLVNLANNSNPQLRNIACKVICHMYKFIGSDLKLLIKNIKESTLKNIYKEMEKIDNSKKINNLNNNIINNKDNNKPVDISNLISSKLLKEIDKGKWQEKKDGIDYIIQIIENANKKILPDGLKDLFELIKEKLSDANKNFVRIIIQLLSSLIISLGENIKVYSKEFTKPLLLNLSDKSQLLREDCVECINKLIDNQNFEIIANFLPQITYIENSDMRYEILNLLMSNINSLLKDNYSESFFKELTKSLISFLQDKNGKIKTKTEAFIIKFKDKLKKKDYLKEIDKYKPSIAEDLKNIFDRIFPEEKTITKKNNTPSKENKPKVNNTANKNNQIKKIDLLNKKPKNNIPRGLKKDLLLNDLNNKSMIIPKAKGNNKVLKTKNNSRKNLIKQENENDKKSLNKTVNNWNKNPIKNDNSLTMSSKKNNLLKNNKNNAKGVKRSPKLSIDETDNDIITSSRHERTITDSNQKTFKLSKEKPIRTERNEDNNKIKTNKKDAFYKKITTNRNVINSGTKKNNHNKVPSLNNSMTKRDPIIKKINTKNNNLNKTEIKSENRAKLGSLNKEELMNTLNTLLNNGQEIVSSLLNVNNKVYKNFVTNKELLIKNSDIIFQTFIDLIKKLFSNEKKEIKIINYVINVLCKISGIKELINKISLMTHKNLISIVFFFVSYEEINKMEEDEEMIIYKIFNSIMLHIIDYCNSSDNICILIQLIKINIKEDKKKLSEYGSRCLAIINQTIKNIYNNLNISEILKEVHLFLKEYEDKYPNLELIEKKDNNVIESIMGLVIELVKAKKDSIIEEYNKGLNNLEKPDNYIKKWIDDELNKISIKEKEMKLNIDEDIADLLSEELLTNI